MHEDEALLIVWLTLPAAAAGCCTELQTAGRPLQLRFQQCQYSGEQATQWYRVLSRSRLYSGAASTGTPSGFLEVGELVCAEAAVQSSAVSSPMVQDAQKAAGGQSTPTERIAVRRQRGPRIGWVSLVNEAGKTMLQSVSTLSKLGSGCNAAWGGGDGAGAVGSLSDVGTGKHCTEAERLFSIELLQGRLQDDALALAASMSARMTALRELVDKKEADLLAEIQGAVDRQSAQLQQKKELCSTSRRVDLPESILDSDRFLAEVDACLHQVSALSVVTPSATHVLRRHAVDIAAPASASASPALELPRDLRQLRATKTNETPSRESGARMFRRSLSEQQDGDGGNGRRLAPIHSSPAAAALTIDASLDLRGELSESPSPSPVGNVHRACDGIDTINMGATFSPQQAEMGGASCRQMATRTSAAASVASNPAKSNAAEGSVTAGSQTAQQQQPHATRLINLPIASGSAGATRKIETPSKKRRMDAFRKSSSSAINA